MTTGDFIHFAVQHLHRLSNPEPSPHPPSYATTVFGRVGQHLTAFPFQSHAPSHIYQLFASTRCCFVAEVRGAPVQRVLADDRALQPWLNIAPVTDVVNTVKDAVIQNERATHGWAFIRETCTLLSWASTCDEMADTLKSVFECMSTTPSPPVLPTLGELSFLPTFTPSATPESLLPSPTELPIINEKNIHAVARKTRHLPAMVASPFTEMISDFQDMWSDPTDPSVFSPDLPRLTISLAEISPPPFVFDIEADAVDDVDDVAMYEGEDVTPYYPASIPSSPELSFSCSDSDESIPSTPDSAILALPVAKQYRRGLPSKPSQPTGKKSEKRTRAREDDDNDDDYLPKRSIIHKRTRRSSSSSPPSAPLLPLATLPDVTPAVALSPRPDRLTAPLPRRARQCATACGGSPPPPDLVKTTRGAGRKAKAKGKGKAKSKGKRPFSCPDCNEDFTRVKDAVRHWTFTCKRNLGRLCAICPGCKKNLSRPDAARRHQNASQCQGTGEIAVLLEQIKGVMSVTEESIRAVAAKVGAVHDGKDAEDAESIKGDGEED